MGVLGTRELCALLLAGGMGATSVVAVQKTKPAVAKASAKPKGERVRTASRPRVARPEPAAPAPILDCPLVGSPFSAEPNPLALPALPPVDLGGGTWAQPPGVWGGGSALPSPPTSLPVVPEPGRWAMLLSGFGLVGLSLRRCP